MRVRVTNIRERRKFTLIMLGTDRRNKKRRRVILTWIRMCFVAYVPCPSWVSRCRVCHAVWSESYTFTNDFFRNLFVHCNRFFPYDKLLYADSYNFPFFSLWMCCFCVVKLIFRVLHLWNCRYRVCRRRLH